MGPNQTLKTALNKMREMSVVEGSIYHQYVPEITDLTSIGDFGRSILEMDDVRNEFMSKLVKRIAETQINSKVYSNKLQQLEGEQLPMGYSVQNLYVNPAKGRHFNVNDFAGLLARYDADVKQEFLAVNMDKQYPVTITKAKLRDAFVSWQSLQDFFDGIVNSLYSGANIDQYNAVKALIANAFRNGRTVNQVVTMPTDEATAKSFTKAARTLAMDFAEASSDYAAWSIVNTEDERGVVTWTDIEDVVFVIRNDVMASVDVDALAAAFNIESAKLMGRIITVKNFDILNDEGQKIYDGSKILGVMADKKFFKIRTQETALESFYNANNRTYNFYYNVTKMLNTSLFANAVVFCTEAPVAIEFGAVSAEVEQGDHEGLDLTVTPETSIVSVRYEITEAPEGGKISDLVLTKSGELHIDVASKEDAVAGDYTLKASVGAATDTITITVTEADS